MKIVVVGGGAAGMFAAIRAARCFPHHRIVLLEAGEPLVKVRLSGGGRCNVTHACFEPERLVQHYPRGAKALRGAFTRFQPRDTVAWFAAEGVPLKTEADGRMFPVTDRADTVAEALLRAAAAAGVEIHSRCPVQAVGREGDGFWVRTRQGTQTADRLVLATGGKNHHLAIALGHDLVPPVPSLFTFNIPVGSLHELAGVTVSAAVLVLPDQAPKFPQAGPLLITHWGLSGPAVLKLSAWQARALHACQYQTPLTVQWLDRDPEPVWQAYRGQYPKRTLGSHSPFPNLSLRLWQYLLARAQGNPHTRWAEVPKRQWEALKRVLRGDRYPMAGKGVFKEEFVTCGGIPLGEVDFRTMQSKRQPGLFFAGEVLDIDGITGGFNFQAAWTTGWLAGTHVGHS
ncbi:MAG: NAD(P)/FAD-dependent oxidoreductase [Pseudanabaenaceae cyanobacterium]